MIRAHHFSHAALALGTVAAAVVFFAVGAVIRLLLGPVSLGPFAGTLQGAIEQALPGITLKYDQAAIEWTRDEGRVNLVVLGAKVLDRNGNVVAEAPKADIDLSARSLFSGDVAVQRITLVGVELGLVHMKEGGVRLGAEGDKNANDVLARLNDVIEAKGSATSSLKSFAVRNARLTLFDETTGLHVVAPKASLVMSAKANAIGLQFNSDVVMSGDTAHVKAEMTLPPDKGPIEGDALITGLDLRALAANAERFKPLGNIALSVNLATRYSVAQGGHLTSASFDLTAAGALPFAALKSKELHVRQMRLSGNYDGVKNHLALNQAELDAAEGVVRLKGAADFQYDQGALASINAGFATSRLALNMPGVFAQPVSFQSFEADGSYQIAGRQFTIAHANLNAPGLALSGSGSITLGEKGQTPGAAMNGKVAPLPVKTLMHYWPLPVAEGTRSWINDNISQGTLGPFVFQTNFAPGVLDQDLLPDEDLKLTFAMSGIEGNYVTGLTHLTGVSGNAVLLGDTFTADFNSGRVGNLAVRDGHAMIPTLHAHGTVGRFTAHVDGQMPDIMALVDMKPLGYATRFGIDPKQTHGAASTDLSFTVPMLEDLSVDAVGISVKAQVSDFAVMLGHLKLSNGAVNFDIDNDHLHETGALTLADSRFMTDWTEDFKTSGSITTHINAKGVLTDAARQALSIGVQNVLTGPVMVDADLQGHSGQLTTADVTMDLSNAALTIPILHLGKPPGLGASGHVAANFAPGDILRDETIRVTGPNVSATGTASFDRNGSLAVLNFTSVKMGPQNDLSFTLTRTAAGNDYALRGRSLDGSLIGRDVGESGPTANGGAHDDTPSGPFHIDAKLDRLTMRDGVAIAPFNLDLAGVGDKPSALSFSGGLAKPGDFTGTIETTATGRKMTLEAGDAGELIKGLFAFDSIKGGDLKLVATLPGRATDADPAPGNTPDYQGTLDIDNFQVLNQPLLARLFSAGSFTGLGDLMGGGGISLEKMTVPFNSKNNVISIRGAIVRGRAIGATADGYVDRPKNQVALKGSLIPAYGINSLFGSIPVLGSVLGSKKGEGLFAATYSATGNADEPKIEVNPLSVLAPGILRQIFQGSIPNPSNAPSNQIQSNQAPSNPTANPTTAQSSAPKPAPH
ncbi:MAG TPA: AsmA-like C-terminal region-containing protein [Rhizomicrobium sp.]|nr:AsmA-like C-terminal region-containing protein [Rhizomicrobium sp.]